MVDFEWVLREFLSYNFLSIMDDKMNRISFLQFPPLCSVLLKGVVQPINEFLELLGMSQRIP